MSATRELVLGTAGHIDHGKTTLVRALTGVDTDRLPEEQRRGITIELGFARWQLDGAKGERWAIGIVDVPGHEALVRTMVAGAGGMDAVLLVISAEDGVMPQTREHLHVCALLGLRHAVVALTKIDRLGGDSSGGGDDGDDGEREELLELAREDVRAELAATPFAAAEIVPVSATTGAGLDALRAAVARMLRSLPGRDRKGAPVLPIDRVFTMRGHGTVVTGTLLSGELEFDRAGGAGGSGGELELVPQGLGRRRGALRVRGMQVHGQDTNRARAGTRTALNLGNVAVDELARGDVLTRGAKVVASDRLLARVEQLGFAAKSWGRDTSLQLCAGTASTAVQLVPLALVDPESGALLDPGASKPTIAPGQAGLARLYLDVPLPIWAGQRLILRAFSAGHMQSEGLTIGGGVVVDPLPERRHPQRRVQLARVLLGDDATAKLQALIDDAGATGIDGDSLAVRAGVEAPGRLLTKLSGAGGPVLTLGSGEARRYVSRNLLEPLVRQAVTTVDRHHAAHPLQPGMGRATLEGSLGPASPALATAAVDAALERGLLRVADRSGSLARPGKGALDPDDLPRPLQEIVDLYQRGGTTPPTLKQVGDALGLETRAVLERIGLLQRNELLVKVSDELSYLPQTHAALLAGVRAHLAAHGELDVQALKGLTGLSRKFVVPWMEHLDHLGVTRREGDRRLPGPLATG